MFAPRSLTYRPTNTNSFLRTNESRGLLNVRSYASGANKIENAASRMGAATKASSDGATININKTAKDSYEDIVEGGRDMAKDAKDYVKGKASEMGVGSTSQAAKTVSNAAEKAKEFVNDKMGSNTTSKVANKVEDAKEYGKEKAEELKHAAAKATRSVGGKALDAKEYVSEKVTEAKDAVSKVARDATSGSGSTVENVIETVKSAASQAMDMASNAASTATTKIGEAASTATSKIGEATKGTATAGVVGSAAETVKTVASKVGGTAKAAYDSVIGNPEDTFPDGTVSMTSKSENPNKFDTSKREAEASNPSVARADELYSEQAKSKGASQKKTNNPNHV